jgi:hypothetical protein
MGRLTKDNPSLRRATQADAPKKLFEQIVKRIRIEKQLASARKKAVYFSVALALSAIAFFLALATLRGTLNQSEFARAFSLVLSDPGAVLANWYDFALFALESLPVVSVLIFFAALLVLLESLKYIARYIGRAVSLEKTIQKKQVNGL